MALVVMPRVLSAWATSGTKPADWERSSGNPENDFALSNVFAVAGSRFLLEEEDKAVSSPRPIQISIFQVTSRKVVSHRIRFELGAR